MQCFRWFNRKLIWLALVGAITQVQAGQTPGMASPWNGPWGNGYLSGESYSPLANPYIGAGYPVAAPAYPFGPTGPGGTLTSRFRSLSRFPAGGDPPAACIDKLVKSC